jgi:hypothetical protein
MGALVMVLALVTSTGHAATITMTPPPPQPPKAQAKPQPQPKIQSMVHAKAHVQSKATCPCDCPRAARHHVKASHHPMRRYAQDGSYRDQAPPMMRWHRSWRTNEAYRPHPAAYATREGHYESNAYQGRYEQDRYQQGLRIDERSFTGGVGYGADGGFVDGYGQMHFANGGGIQNGPTYNSYGQSFQFNPSHAAPFQPRMGGSGGFGSRGR